MNAPLDLRAAVKNIGVGEEVRNKAEGANRIWGGSTEVIALSSLPFTLQRECFGIVFINEGSNPGARLQFTAKGKVDVIAPGDHAYGKMEGGTTFAAAPGCPTTGNAVLLLLTSPTADFIQAPIRGPILSPTMLLGTRTAAGAYSFITVAEDTDPSGDTPAGAFTVTGWKQIRLLIDTLSAAANATSFDLIPWVNPVGAGTTVWFEQGTQRISVPDTDTTGGRFRIVNLDVGGAGQMYFSIRNLLAAGRTGLNFAVEGIA